MQQLGSSTATTIHNAAHAGVTAVGVGTTVHDFVAVTGQPGKSDPVGERDDRLVPERDCTGAPAATSRHVRVERERSGGRDVVQLHGRLGRAACVPRPLRGRRDVYGSNGACEPLQVVDANIQITPASATNAVGTQHMLTCHINVNAGDGAGFERPGGDCLHGEHHRGARYAGDAELQHGWCDGYL